MPRFKKTFSLSTFLIVVAALAAYVGYEVREINIDTATFREIKRLHDEKRLEAVFADHPKWLAREFFPETKIVVAIHSSYKVSLNGSPFAEPLRFAELETKSIRLNGLEEFGIETADVLDSHFVETWLSGPRLRFVSLSFQRTTDSGLQMLSKLKNLTSINVAYLDDVPLTRNVLEAWLSSSTIMEINLRSVRFTPDAFRWKIDSSRRLDFLGMTNSAITSDQLEDLADSGLKIDRFHYYDDSATKETWNGLALALINALKRCEVRVVADSVLNDESSNIAAHIVELQELIQNDPK